MKTSANKKGHKAVFGIYESKESVEGAVEILKNKGFRSSDISVLMPTVESTHDFAYEKATKAPEGLTTGATTGAIVGGGLGWLVGIGSLAIPGIGPFVAAGPIVAALAGAGVGGAVGSIALGLIGLGIPEYEAKRYEGIVKSGGVLLSTHVDDSELSHKAQEILKNSGAKDISVVGEVSVDKDIPRIKSENDINITNTY